jgi:hypothetical protein
VSYRVDPMPNQATRGNEVVTGEKVQIQRHGFTRPFVLPAVTAFLSRTSGHRRRLSCGSRRRNRSWHSTCGTCGKLLIYGARRPGWASSAALARDEMSRDTKDQFHPLDGLHVVVVETTPTRATWSRWR